MRRDRAGCWITMDEVLFFETCAFEIWCEKERWASGRVVRTVETDGGVDNARASGADALRRPGGRARARRRAAKTPARSRASSSRASPAAVVSSPYASRCARTKTARASTTSRPNRGSRRTRGPRRTRSTSCRRRSTATTSRKPYESSKPTTTPCDSLFARTSFHDPLRVPPIRVS